MTTSKGDRVLIAANRLPVSVRVGLQGGELVPSSGGLATGLKPWHDRSNSLWFGWTGELAHRSADNRKMIGETLRTHRMAPVHLDARQIEGYYHGYTNRVLWPLFHYSIDRVPVGARGWREYQEVNEAFANEIASEYQPGDMIWVHDYHLMLLPGLLRERLPHARIGFFLHIPFPASEVFRVLPNRCEILTGLLGADLVGFHTFGYMRHFMTSLLHVCGIEADVDRIRVGERQVRVGVFPMGVDAGRFAALASEAEVRSRTEAIRRDAAGRRIVLGVDRLDYTKGIPRRIDAIAQLLDREPALRDGIRYIQVAVPTRTEVDSYQRFRGEVEAAVGRINGTYGTLQSLPIHYVHQSVSATELAALYCAADVMLVTPLRDGMNLVAKEFVASRVDEDGVLVLSEFAGAAAELQGAVTVNPYDVDAIGASVERGLSMPPEEKRARMRALRRQVREGDVFAWTDRFLSQLQSARKEAPVGGRAISPSVTKVLAELRRTRDLGLLLDYDGTLVPIARSPERAVPDAGLVRLLDDLASAPGIHVDIVSGRPRAFLERWFGHLSIGLWAEHGFWRREQDSHRWDAVMPVALNWMTRVKPILDQFAASTPGAHVEVKTASMAWHYRGVARDFGTRQAHELRLLLGDLLSNQPVEVLQGKKVIEIRMRGVSKALAAHRIRTEGRPGVALVAIGDDQTDDDLFRAVEPGGLTIAVGRSSSAARFVVTDYRDVRRLLTSLLRDSEPGSYRSDPANRHAIVA